MDNTACCPTNVTVLILQGVLNNSENDLGGNELRDDGGLELRDDGGIELRD